MALTPRRQERRMEQGKVYWTTRELVKEAARLGRQLSQRTVQRLCDSGEIEAIRPGRDYLIPDHAARAWLRDLAAGRP